MITRRRRLCLGLASPAVVSIMIYFLYSIGTIFSYQRVHVPCVVPASLDCITGAVHRNNIVVTSDQRQQSLRMQMMMMMSVRDGDDDSIVRAMKNARDNEGSGTSPGAGLPTADEQADAAYADLINTSMDQR